MNRYEVVVGTEIMNEIIFVTDYLTMMTGDPRFLFEVVKSVMKENGIIFRICNTYGEQYYRLYVIPDTIKNT